MKQPLSMSLLVAALLQSGCGWMNDDRGFIVNRSDDYLEAKERPGIEVPDDLSTERVREPFAVPPINSRRAETFPARAPRPQPIFANDSSREVKIQKLGERRWLVLPEPPAVVWPKIKQFLADNGVDTTFEAVREGRLTSVWLDLEGGRFRDVVRLAILQGKADAGLTGGRERLEIALEQGLRPDSSELHLRYDNSGIDGALAVGPSSAALTALSSDALVVEEKLLRELGGFLASDVSAQIVSMMGREIVGATKARLDTDGSGQPVLLLDLDFDRAWASVNQALDNAEVEITDLDRTAGVFYVDLPERALTGEDNSGLFRGIRGRRGSVLPMQIQVLAAPAGGYQVRAMDRNAERPPAELARNVLNLIKEFAV